MSPRFDAPVARMAASRRAFDGSVPVFTCAPPSTAAFSMMATFLPSLEAWIAAFWPAGPVPMTQKS